MMISLDGTGEPGVSVEPCPVSAVVLTLLEVMVNLGVRQLLRGLMQAYRPAKSAQIRKEKIK